MTSPGPNAPVYLPTQLSPGNYSSSVGPDYAQHLLQGWWLGQGGLSDLTGDQQKLFNENSSTRLGLMQGDLLKQGWEWMTPQGQRVSDPKDQYPMGHQVAGLVAPWAQNWQPKNLGGMVGFGHFEPGNPYASQGSSPSVLSPYMPSTGGNFSFGGSPSFLQSQQNQGSVFQALLSQLLSQRGGV